MKTKLLLCLLLAALGPGLRASPIVYSFSGTSCTIDGGPQGAWRFDFFADTDTVGGSGTYGNGTRLVTLTVAGLGSGNVFFPEDYASWGASIWSVSDILGEGPGSNIGFVVPGFATVLWMRDNQYDLSTSFGPITATVVGYGANMPGFTGDLTFLLHNDYESSRTETDLGVFRAVAEQQEGFTFQARLHSAPDGGYTLLLLLLALPVLGAAKRRTS